MKTLYLQTQMGAAGDMLCAALLDLFEDRQAVLDELNQLGLPGVVYHCKKQVSHQIGGLHLDVYVNGLQEETKDGPSFPADAQSGHPHVHDESCHCGHSHDHDEHCHGEHSHGHDEQCRCGHSHDDHEHCHGEHSHSHDEHCYDHDEHCQGEHSHSHDAHCHGEHPHDHNAHRHDKHCHCEHSHDHDEHCHGGHSHPDEHCHGHHPSGHGHSHLADVLDSIEASKLSPKAKEKACAVFTSIAQAEGSVHQMHMNEIHFHEVGTLDAVADVCAFCFLMEKLQVDRVLCSPVCTGFGTVSCAHGLLPVPAPATALLLEGIPCYAGSVEGELCTPTGAALLKAFVDSFEEMPVMKVKKIGYGMGTREYPVLNCVRAFLGEDTQTLQTVCELVCNLDDMSAEQIGYACSVLLEEGALDVWTQPITMKKSRPGIQLHVLCKETMQNRFLEEMFLHTTTLGIRILPMQRAVLERHLHVIQTPYGEMVVKESSGYGVVRRKIEYEDLKDAASQSGKSLLEISRELESLL